MRDLAGQADKEGGGGKAHAAIFGGMVGRRN
jgi:hypothetical protein